MRISANNSNDMTELKLIAYPGDGSSTEERNYGFDGKNLEKFQFSATKSSIFKCGSVVKRLSVSSDVQLKSNLGQNGVFWSQDFNGSFCCHASKGKQWTAECALMQVSKVS